MFKTVVGIYRRDDLSFDDFMSYWTTQHADLIRQVAVDLGIIKYVQLHLSDGTSQDGKKPDSSKPNYDGIAEVWYESEAVFRASLASDNGKHATNLILEDQKKFMGGNATLVFKGVEAEMISI